MIRFELNASETSSEDWSAIQLGANAGADERVARAWVRARAQAQ